jgi:NDP-mannose synthase
MFKRAIILAGGKGTRLKPYTISLPKPLVPVGDVPILEIIIRKLAKQGFGHITITLNHMAEIMMAFFNDGSKWGVKIDYSIESKPLSTMGPLTLIPDLPDNFMVLNGDVLTDLDFGGFFSYHLESKNDFTIAAYQREEEIDYGVLYQDKKHKLSRFEEKPTYNFLVSMGIYMLNKEILSYIPHNTFFGFDHLMNLLLQKNEPPTIYQHNGYWLDIGRPDDYEKALNDIDNQKINL